MEQTGSCKILYAEEMGSLVSGLVASMAGLKSAAIESLNDLLDFQDPLFPFRPDFDEAVRQPVVVLHSSGSTRLPKPVVMTHGTFTIMDSDRNFPTMAGRKIHDLTV